MLGGVRDLREKLSGTMHSQPVNADPPKPKPKPRAVEAARKSVAVEAPVPEAKKLANSAPRKMTQQKAYSKSLSSPFHFLFPVLENWVFIWI